MSILKNILSFIKNNKYLILLSFALTLIFIILLLPYNDINTYISSKINTYTNGKIQFKAKKFYILPSLSLGFNDNLISYKKTEAQIKKITIKPLWLDSLLLNFGINVTAYSIFGGDITFSLKQIKSKKHNLAFNANLQNISLDKLPLNSIKLGGKVSAIFQTLIDVNLFNTPNINIKIDSNKKIQIFNSKIPSNFGPIQIPSTSFSKLKAMITTKNEVVNIKTLELGSPTDNIYIKIKGNINLKIKKERRTKILSVKSYKLSIYIKAQQVPSQLKSLFSLINSYQLGNTYSFNIKGDGLMSIPEITK